MTKPRYTKQNPGPEKESKTTDSEFGLLLEQINLRNKALHKIYEFFDKPKGGVQTKPKTE